jgi:hypothetical protein
MTKTKLRRILKLAKDIAKLDQSLSHDLETLAMGAEQMPHIPKFVEASHFTKAIQTVQNAFANYPYALVGGLAVQHWVTVRPTDDIDFALLANDLSHVKKLFPGGSETSLVYTVKIEGVNVDFMHSHIFPWTPDAIKHAIHKSESGIPLPVVTPEYLILYKMKAARFKDLEDIKALIRSDRGIYGKGKKLIQSFTAEDLEDFEQLAREAEYGV